MASQQECAQHVQEWTACAGSCPTVWLRYMHIGTRGVLPVGVTGYGSRGYGNLHQLPGMGSRLCERDSVERLRVLVFRVHCADHHRCTRHTDHVQAMEG